MPDACFLNAVKVDHEGRQKHNNSAVEWDRPRLIFQFLNHGKSNFFFFFFHLQDNNNTQFLGLKVN